MNDVKKPNSICDCFNRAHSENIATSENTRKIISISLSLVQIVGVLLLAASLPGSTGLVAMHETVILSLALGGGVILLGGSFLWAMLGYHQKHSAVKKGLYVLTALAVLTITIGIIGYNGLLSGMSISAARCTMAAGFIIGMPIIFPCLFSLLTLFQSKLAHSQAEQVKAARDHLLGHKQSTIPRVDCPEIEKVD